MKRIPELDGLRAIAIIQVVIYHYCKYYGGSGHPLARPFQNGLTGVDLFFVISGYLITGILLNARESTNYFRVFYIRRAYRILPLYWLLFGSYLLISWAMPVVGDNSLIPTWSYAVFGQNIFNAVRDTWGPGWMSATWSLAVEEQFYLTLPLVVQFAPPRALPWIAGAAVAVAPMFRALIPGSLGPYALMPCRLDCLGAGVLLAIAMRHEPARRLVARWSIPATVLLAIKYATIERDHWTADTPLWVCAFYAALIAAVLTHRGRLTAPLRWGVAQKIGCLSYSIYLFHQPVNVFAGAIPASSLARGCAAAAATLALAALSWKVFEHPLIQRGHAHKYAYATSQAKIAEERHCSSPAPCPCE